MDDRALNPYTATTFDVVAWVVGWFVMLGSGLGLYLALLVGAAYFLGLTR